MTSTLTRRSVLLACAAAGTAGCGGGEDVSAPPRAAPGDVRSTPGRERVRALLPLHLTIPSIGVSTSLVLLGLDEDRTVEVPTAPGRAGWFRLGTVPGQRGSSVILGHVDSTDGPAVFADLSTMGRPDRVDVVLSNDTIVSFEVTDVETYANADFPAERVYAGTTRARELNLVTCGGEYDPERGGYQSNVVVFTRRSQRTRT